MKTITITHSTGLHARPSGIIAKEAQQFDSEITLVREDKEYNAKSIMSVMSMGASQGDEIGIRANGPDAEDAENALVVVFERINAE